MAIGFPMRRSHQLIATPITLRLPPRFAVLFGSPFRLPARLVVSRLVPVLSVRPVLVSSSRSSHLVLLSFLSLSRRGLPHS